MGNRAFSRSAILRGSRDLHSISDPEDGVPDLGYVVSEVMQYSPLPDETYFEGRRKAESVHIEMEETFISINILMQTHLNLQ